VDPGDICPPQVPSVDCSKKVDEKMESELEVGTIQKRWLRMFGWNQGTFV
jgi:hypothetical protein